jgi:hypothetical protein
MIDEIAMAVSGAAGVAAIAAAKMGLKTRAIGEEAARVLIEQIITGDWSPIEKMIGGRIILRESA